VLRPSASRRSGRGPPRHLTYADWRRTRRRVSLVTVYHPAARRSFQPKCPGRRSPRAERGGHLSITGTHACRMTRSNGRSTLPNAGETGSGVRFYGHPVAVRLPRVARFHMRRRAPLQPIRATSCQAPKRERAQSSPNSIKLKPSLLAKPSS
jgi:hypothetical protein